MCSSKNYKLYLQNFLLIIQLGFSFLLYFLCKPEDQTDFKWMNLKLFVCYLYI